jgi:hypothetical protein
MYFSPTFVPPLSLQVRSLTPPFMQGTPGHVITQSIAYQLGAPSTELFQAISCAFIVLMADNRFLILISLWKSNEKSGRYEKAMTLVV